MNILVVGGAGYIGSHCVRKLIAAGHTPIVLDNLSRGHQESIPEGVHFYKVSAGDRSEVIRILNEEQIDVVMHFAAYAYIGESFECPLRYYENNVAQTIRLLQSMVEAGVCKFVFSSTCATYGIPPSLPISETMEQAPINPYGESKLSVERLLRSLADRGEMSSTVFRYFNAAGAGGDGLIGEDHNPEPHLIPLAIGAASGKYPPLKIFGTDYPTSDGTCLRDYVHVDDIAEAHISVLTQFDVNIGFVDYNLGMGSPVSVLEILEAVEQVVGSAVPYETASRREGDPPSLYADAEKARRELNFVPKYQSIQEIIASAWKWHQSHPNGYGK